VKSLMIVLFGFGGLVLAYFFSKQAQATAQTNAQTKGTSDPNYRPVGSLFAPDQPGSDNHGSIVPTGATAAPPVVKPSGTTYPETFQLTDMPITGTLSPSFWAADHVPPNPALPESLIF